MKKYFVLTGKGKNVLGTIQRLNRIFAGINVSIVDLADLYKEDKDFRAEVKRLSSGSEKKAPKSALIKNWFPECVFSTRDNSSINLN